MEHASTVAILTLALVTAPALAGGVSTQMPDNGESVWLPEDKLLPRHPAAHFGSDVAVQGNIAVVGAPGTEEAFLYERTPAGWLETATLTPSSHGDGFGRSVAIDGTGELLAVGAPFDSAIHVFERGPDGWAEEATLEGEGALGVGLDIQSGTVVAGAPETGEVVFFEEESDSWTRTPSVSGERGFGLSVSLDRDAETAAVGSILADEVHILERSEGDFVETAVLGAPGGFLGFGVTLTANGDKLAAGAPGHGHVHVFEETEGSWAEEAQLAASDPTRAGLDDGLGIAVDISDDGSKIVAGNFHSDPSKPGAAFLFVQDEEEWNQAAALLPPEPVPGAAFGRSVDLFDGAEEALVGAPRYGAPVIATLQPGTVYGFTLSPSPSTEAAGGGLS